METERNPDIVCAACGDLIRPTIGIFKASNDDHLYCSHHCALDGPAPRPPGVIGTLVSMMRSQEPKLIYVYEKDWLGLKAENQRLKDLLAKSVEDVRLALERMDRTDSSDHDWRAEASGLAYMICQIHDNYIFAEQSMGGDSEFLASAIFNAYGWVDGPLRTHFEGPEVSDDGN